MRIIDTDSQVSSDHSRSPTVSVR